MSPVQARSTSRFAGRRLSAGRLVLSIAGVLVLAASVTAAAVLPALPQPVDGAPSDARWFASYYDVTLESGEQLATTPLGSTSGGAVLAFVVAADDEDCTPTWGKAYSLDEAATTFELDRRVARMQRDGRPLAVSFGGAANTELAGACSGVSQLTTAYRTVMDRYGIDVMDLDIEGEMLADEAATERRAQAVARLQRERIADGAVLDVWLTLPVAPQGLTEAGLAQIRSLLDAGVVLAGVNVMTMNYGTVGADGTVATMSSLSIDALQATAVQLARLWRAQGLELPAGGAWALLGATPMIGLNDVDGEVFTLDDAHAVSAFAGEKGLARLSMWSLNRDRTCGGNYPNVQQVSTSCSGIEQAGESFADVFAEGYGGMPGGRTVSAEEKAAAAEAAFVPDDPKTSPYPVWSSQTYYSAGVKVVWHGSVYVAKWWTEDGRQPDDPTLDVGGSAWTYLGPVLPDEPVFALPQLEPGTYTEWSETTLYDQGDRVMFEGTGYEARWWSQGKSPDRSVLDRDYSPWKMLAVP